MDTVTLVEAAAVALAVFAAWKSLPRPVARDGERLLKVALSTVIRGEVEAAQGSAEDWRDRVLPVALFHPAGRAPETKLLEPDPASLQTPALPGERGLVEDLARMEDPRQRLRRMYVEAEAAAEALLSDPALHGEAWDLSAHLAPDLSWDAVAGWTEPLQGVLERRLGHVVAVELGGASVPLGAALPAGDGGVIELSEPAWAGEAEDWEPGGAEEALEQQLLAAVERPEQRLVVICHGGTAGALMRAIAGRIRLRDRVVAVVLVDPSWTPHERAWLTRWFTHPSFEPEVVRRIPYATLLACDPDEPESWARWPQQRLPLPPEPSTGRLVVDVVDFGPIDLSAAPPQALARALVIWLALGLGA